MGEVMKSATAGMILTIAAMHGGLMPTRGPEVMTFDIPPPESSNSWGPPKKVNPNKVRQKAQRAARKKNR
jgi:hypothetical protein